MKKKTFTKSKQPRKQRKSRYDAPLHVRQKFVHVHLTKELRSKYDKRKIGLKKGDTVKVLRGQFKKHTGKVENIDLKKSKAIISGIEITKKDGSKVTYPINVTNLIITEINLGDKFRTKALERKKQ
jgi:large subunit ribosomal protein L24